MRLFLFQPLNSAQRFRANIKATLDYLQQHLPRALVNVVGVFDLNKFKNTCRSSPSCSYNLR